MVDFEVVDLGPSDHVSVGETAPDFTRPLVTTEGWDDRSLADALGSGPTVLVFTTMAGAFLAEYTLTELRDRGIGVADEPAIGDGAAESDSGSNDAAGSEGEAEEGPDRSVALSEATVLAVSISSPYELAPFLRENDLPYGVFSDPKNAVADSYGVVHDLDGMAGISEPRPAIFVLDGDRTVDYAWVATEWPDFPDYDALEDALAGE